MSQLVLTPVGSISVFGFKTPVPYPFGLERTGYLVTNIESAPSYPALKSVPENRIYVSTVRAAAFIHSFLAFSDGKVTSDEIHAPGTDIGRPRYSYRRIKITSTFGKMTVFATDGRLPYPYGRELTGYEVEDLADTLAKATAAGAVVLVAPYVTEQRNAAIVQFPGGYIAEIHSPAPSPGR
jgi:hypothetical protein